MTARNQKHLADLFLFLVGMIWIAFFAIAKIIPVFMEKWAELGVELSTLQKILVSLSQLFRQYFVIFLPLLLAIMLLSVIFRFYAGKQFERELQRQEMKGQDENPS